MRWRALRRARTAPCRRVAQGTSASIVAYRGCHEGSQAFRLGLHHGLFCIGCCWSLMLLMFAVGAGNLGWMLVLGAVMAIEKNLPWGRRVSAPLGVVLLCGGLALGLQAVLA